MNRNFKQGMYNTVIIVFVVAITILLNLFVGQMNLFVDLTTDEVYTLTEETDELASNIEDDITIYYIATEKDQYEVLKNVVYEYDKYKNIEVKWKDPELYPQFASQYTDETIQGNDVVVVNNTTDSYRFIPFDELYIVDQSINYTTMQTDQNYILDAEGKITSALQFVTEKEHTKMYVVYAHDESPLDEEVTDLIENGNIEIENLDMRSTSEIPDDCSVLMINGPTTDISDNELELYKKYLDNGGGAIFTVAYTNEPLENYNELLAYYGAEVTHSVILEEEGEHLPEYPTYLMNVFASLTDEVSSEFTTKDFMVMPISVGIKAMDAANLRSTLKTSVIMETSEGSYAKTNAESEIIEKEEGDFSGPFATVISATDTYKDKTGKAVILATPYVFKAEWIDYYSCANMDFFIDCIDWLKGGKSSIAIPQRNLNQVLLEVEPSHAVIWGIITIAVIPVGIIFIGLVIWLRRRKH